MSDDEDMETQKAWVPLSQRKEWSDVTPIPPKEDGPPVVRIIYSPRFLEVFNYYRAVVTSQEVSQRVLNLTEEALELNPANYSVWHHRRALLKALNADLNAELNYVRSVIEENPKNYQVWQHRKILIEWAQDPSKDLRLTEIVLSQDAKNYHAWQHRQWIVKTFKLYDHEINFVERLLTDDIRNNSAWNHRFFVVSHEMCPDATLKDVRFSGSIMEREIDFTLQAIRDFKENESSWNYLGGLLDHCHESEKAKTFRRVYEFCHELFDEESNRSQFLVATLVDLETRFSECEVDGEKKNEMKKNAKEYCHLLANEVDPIRKDYWNFVASKIGQS